MKFKKNTTMELINNKLIVRNFPDALIIPLMDIIRIESKNNYSYIYFTNGERIVLTKHLKNFEILLCSNKYFERTHHSHIINLFHAKSYIKENSSLVLSNRENVPISRRKRKKVIEKIQNMLINY